MRNVTLVVALVSLVGMLVVGEGSSPRSRRRHGHFAPKRLRSPSVTAPRIVLGRVGGQLVAAEPHHSVLVVGPTQSGKTSKVVIPAICHWPGPVLVSSVKGDVLHQSRRARALMGKVTIVDPSRTTGEVSAQWLPYRGLTSFREARSLARDLCAAATSVAQSGEGEFWMNAAARYLGPLLLAAARSDAPLEALLSWLDEDEVNGALAILDEAGDHDAYQVLLQLLRRDSRQLHSIVTTAEVVVEALVDGAGGGEVLDVDAFLNAPAAMYLLAPLGDQQRNRAMLTALRHQVISRASELAEQQGGRLRLPLLVVQDEAGHSAGLEHLSALAATGVGQGITALTVFQDMGQIAHSQGALASSLVLNHRARIMMAGTIDQASVDLFVKLSGEQRRQERSHSTSRQGRSVTRQEVTQPRLERHHVSGLKHGSAILLYDALAPMALRLNAVNLERRAPKVAHARPRAPRRATTARRGEER